MQNKRIDEDILKNARHLLCNQAVVNYWLPSIFNEKKLFLFTVSCMYGARNKIQNKYWYENIMQLNRIDIRLPPRIFDVIKSTLHWIILSMAKSLKTWLL